MNACTRYLTHAWTIILLKHCFSSLVVKHWTWCSGPRFDSWLKYLRIKRTNVQNTLWFSIDSTERFTGWWIHWSLDHNDKYLIDYLMNRFNSLMDPLYDYFLSPTLSAWRFITWFLLTQSNFYIFWLWKLFIFELVPWLVGR